ncbi:thiopeptide-type bacteriocin biosynthesis protein [Algoriphagus terrigena]|uniref:thiopeptide-type bacteriocin biosynthesis protein n=1 Tax=Algoriphagus terrigena TaxID=344884 RepID=UPI0004190097|nr:thiopeptide-type bacteriocin biosynthesis protein [Algoriphagus terrigena]
MDFLFRMHLVDFDPADEKEIIKHWRWIKEALALSSKSLTDQIGNSDYESLSRTIKNKIYKYLLRGRYRSTPFGLWAGVGVGNWGIANAKQTVSLSYSEIDSDQKRKLPDAQDEKTDNFKLAPGSQLFENHIKYWNYSPTDEGWRICHLKRNKIVDLLVSHLRKKVTMNFTDFVAFFNHGDKALILKMWKTIVQSGIIIPEDFPWNASCAIPSHESKDLKLESNIILNPSIKNQLDALPEEMGSLFATHQSEYIRRFKEWFLKKFDDRSVPLTLLSNHLDFEDFLTHTDRPTTDPHETLHPELFGPEDLELDLLQLYPKKPIPSANHIQFVFKVGAGDRIYMENIACNRPFAYSGRFSFDAEICQVTAKAAPEAAPDESVIYADLCMLESQKANYVMRHKNLYPYTINPFGAQSADRIIGLDDLLLGIRENQVVLYSETLRKAVVPVIQHPLNPDQISHPLSRLFWEVGFQNQIQFLPYHHSFFQSSTYLPRLKWGSIVLQGRRWSVSSCNYSNKKDLAEYLRQLKMPNQILAGYLDREFLLDWTNERDLDLFWEELQQQKTLQVYECEWKNDPTLFSKNGAPCYPQFIHSWAKWSEKLPSPGFVNRITKENRGWVYARIFPKRDALTPFLFTCLPVLVSTLKAEFSVPKWYYLNYQSPEPEIRLRIKLSHSDQKTAVESKIRELSVNSGWIREIDFVAYYPETDKYGNRGISVSESVFSLESELVLFGRQEQLPSLHLLEETERLEFIVSMATAVFLMSSDHRNIFLSLKKMVKQLSVPIKKEAGRIGLSRKFEPEGIFQQEYASLFLSHEQFTGEKRLLMLFHHIHMFCNRAFTEDPSDWESRLICLLYRRMGKEMFVAKPVS